MIQNYPNQRPLLGAGYADQDSPDQLTQLQRTAPYQIRTPGALASNLLADALLQYGQNRRLASGQSNAPPQPPPVQLPVNDRAQGWLMTGQDPYDGQTLTPGGAPLALSNNRFDSLWGDQ